MTFKPGQSGNPAGRPKTGHSIADHIRTALDRKKGDRTNAEIIADKLVEMAQSEDTELAFKASRELIDRMIGKPVQQVVEESTQTIEVTRNVHHKND